MAVNIPQLKQAQKKIMNVYGISAENAARVIGSYHTDEQKIMAILAGDFSTVPAAAASVNVSLGYIKGDQDIKQDHKSVHPDKIRTATPKTTGSGLTALSKSDTDIIPTVNGEIIDNNELPPDYYETIKEWLEEIKVSENIEDFSKLANIQWRAVCLSIGDKIQKSGILRDRERERTHGGKIYNPYIIAAIIPIWERITAYYKHIPLACDFIAFTGVSEEYFYDTKRELTSSRLGIAKKVRAIEEKALAAALTDSRENPTGRIYYTKARLGWRETTEIIHTSVRETKTAAALPIFDGSNGFSTE